MTRFKLFLRLVLARSRQAEMLGNRFLRVIQDNQMYL